jgi:hypothetical protein
MLLPAIYLILAGINGLVGLGPLSILVALFALAAGLVILIGR